MEQSTVNQRLNLIVDTFENGVKAAFARKAGISPQGAQEILAGRKGDPSFKVLVKILESYPTLDANWLVLGRGAMLRTDISASTDSSSQRDFPGSIEELNTLAASYARSEELQERVKQLFSEDVLHGYIQNILERKVDERLERERKQILFTAQFNEQLMRERIEDMIWLEQEAESIQAEAVQNGDKAATARLEEIRHAIRLLGSTHVREGEMLDSFSYNIDTAMDSAKPFGGSLARRLNVTEDIAREIVLSGKINSLQIEGQGYTVSERAVCRYLQKQIPPTKS